MSWKWSACLNDSQTRFRPTSAASRPAIVDAYSARLWTQVGSEPQHLPAQAGRCLFNFARRVGYLPDKTTAATRSGESESARARDRRFSARGKWRDCSTHASDNLRPFVVRVRLLRPAASRGDRVDWIGRKSISTAVRFSVSAGKSENAIAPVRAAARERGGVVADRSPKQSGKVVGTVADRRNALRRLGAAREESQMKRNALRHSFCSYRLALTMNANQVALEAGHSADILFKHYRQLCTETEAKRWFSLAPAGSEKVVPMVASA